MITLTVCVLVRALALHFPPISELPVYHVALQLFQIMAVTQAR